MSEYNLIIDDTPIAQPRARVTRFATYDPAHDKKTWIKFQMREQFIKEKLLCPIELDIIFYMPIPKSTSKKKKALMLSGEIKHVKRADIDNLYKLVTDTMTGIIYHDDSQIYKAYIEKVYSDKPRTQITIKWCDDD